jgi:hypothetical protein
MCITHWMLVKYSEPDTKAILILEEGKYDIAKK